MKHSGSLANFPKGLIGRLLVMVDAGLVTYREYQPWADEVIRLSSNPPIWVTELAVVSLRSEALNILREAALKYEESCMLSPDEVVAALYLRYERSELSWASFLFEAGQKSDVCEGRKSCEYFFDYLNILYSSGFSKNVEDQQRATFLLEYKSVTSMVRNAYMSIVNRKSHGEDLGRPVQNNDTSQSKD